MSASKNKGPSEGTMGLTISEARLLLLGLVCEVGGKVDFNLLGQKAGITTSSARTMYPKAKKKLIQLQAASESEGDEDTPTPAKKKATPKKAARPAKKRKVSEQPEAQSESEIADPIEGAIAGPETDETDAAEPVAGEEEH